MHPEDDRKVEYCVVCHIQWSWRRDMDDPLICTPCRETIEGQFTQIRGFYAYRARLIGQYAQQPPNE